jgi:hypothetical protein
MRPPGLPFPSDKPTGLASRSKPRATTHSLALDNHPEFLKCQCVLRQSGVRCPPLQVAFAQTAAGRRSTIAKVRYFIFFEFEFHFQHHKPCQRISQPLIDVCPVEVWRIYS